MLGKLEQEIMQLIWQSKRPLSVKDITKTLQKKKKIAYTTVMTVMVRLVEKQILQREVSNHLYVYSPKISKEKFVQNTIHNVVSLLIHSLGDSALSYFIKEIKDLNKSEIKRLVKHLDEK